MEKENREKAIMEFIKWNSKVFRNTQIYIDHVLKPYELSSGTFHYLLILDKTEGISQNAISKEIANDKAMSARTIARLIELGFVYKKQDERDSRANLLFLTEKGKALIPKIHEEIHGIIDLITVDLTEDEKVTTVTSLKKIYERVQLLNRKGVY